MAYLFLFILIGVGAVAALVAAVAALGAYLRYRRARIELQDRLTSEVEGLTRRTGELEEGLAALQRRSSQLPITIAELQKNLSALQLLTGALAGSLRQAQKALSYSVLGALRSTSPGRLIGRRQQ